MLGGEEVFVPLNDVIEPEKSSFLEAVLDIYKYNGNYYGIEYHVGAPMMYYRTIFGPLSRKWTHQEENYIPNCIAKRAGARYPIAPWIRFRL